MHTDNGPATVGGYKNSSFNASVRTVVTSRNLFTGEQTNSILRVKSTNSRKGETVYSQQQIIDIDTIK